MRRGAREQRLPLRHVVCFIFGFWGRRFRAWRLLAPCLHEFLHACTSFLFFRTPHGFRIFCFVCFFTFLVLSVCCSVLFGSCCLDARGTVHPLGECFDDARIASGPDSATETPRRTMEGGCLRVHAWLGNDFSQRRQDYGRRNNRPRMDHGLRMLKMLDNFAAATTKMTRRRCFLLQRYRGDEDAAVCANVAQGLLMGP